MATIEVSARPATPMVAGIIFFVVYIVIVSL